MIEKSVTPDTGYRESIFRKREAYGDRSDGSPLTTGGDDGESHLMPEIRHRASILASFPMEPRSHNWRGGQCQGVHSGGFPLSLNVLP